MGLVAVISSISFMAFMSLEGESCLQYGVQVLGSGFQVYVLRSGSWAKVLGFGA